MMECCIEAGVEGECLGLCNYHNMSGEEIAKIVKMLHDDRCLKYEETIVNCTRTGYESIKLGLQSALHSIAFFFPKHGYIEVRLV